MMSQSDRMRVECEDQRRPFDFRGACQQPRDDLCVAQVNPVEVADRYRTVAERDGQVGQIANNFHLKCCRQGAHRESLISRL